MEVCHVNSTESLYELKGLNRSNLGRAKQFFVAMVRFWRHRSPLVQKLVEPHIQNLFPFHKPELEGVSPVKASYSGKIVKAPFDLAIAKVVPFGQDLTASRKDIVKVKIHKLCLNKFLLKVRVLLI